MDVKPGGGVRRNPKRKNAGTYSTSFDAKSPSPEEVDRVFELHLRQMAQGGTYGDNMEITAFCKAYNVDVKIYHRSFALMVPVDHAKPATQVVHIAYHVSVRPPFYSSTKQLLISISDLGALLFNPQSCWTPHWTSNGQGDCSHPRS